MTTAAIAVAAALQAAAPDPAAPTVIEHAIVTYQCRATRAANGEGSDADLKCYNDTLAALRADFGRDLSRITAADRKTLDSACGQIDTERREAYLECLNNQLAALRSRRSRGKPAPAAATAAPAAAPPAAEGAPPDIPVATPLPASSSAMPSIPVLIGGGVATVLLLAGGIVALRARRRRNCRVCGAAVEDSGDLCAKCRHEAAESLRRASIQRAEAERVERERRRRLAEVEDDQRREQARREDEERAQQEEQERRREELSRQRLEEEARQRRAFGAAGRDDAFDPHAVLGVPPDARLQDIEAAYQAAKLRYDLNEVAHLGLELQEYYKAKAAAVERAYKLLIEQAGGAGGEGEAGGAGGAGGAGEPGEAG